MKGIGYASVVFIFFLLPLARLKAQVKTMQTLNYISPVPGSSLNMPQTTIAIRTSKEIDPASLAAGGIISVTAASSGDHAGRVVLSDDRRTVIFIPTCRSQKGRRLPSRSRRWIAFDRWNGVSTCEIQFYDNTKIVESSSFPDKVGRTISFPAPSRIDVFRFAAKDSALPATFPI